MSRNRIITFRATEEEYETITKLTQILHRTKSDSIRFILTLVLRLIEKDPDLPGAIVKLDPTKFV